MRTLHVHQGRVPCLINHDEPVDKCRFCVHSVRFILADKEIESPARAFCQIKRVTSSVDLSEVTGVVCDDMRNEGYRSMMNVIS
jgi:hypothetical protein